MTDNDLRAALAEITDDVCGTSVLQIADRLKSLHNKILADHARTLIKEAFPQYQTAVFVRYWDEDTPRLLHLLSDTEPQLDYHDDEQRRALDGLRQECLRTAERCIVYLGTDEEVADLLPTENQHEDYVEFDLDLDAPGALAEPEPEPTPPRYHSSDPEHLREDFTAAFKAAMEPRLWAHVDFYGPARQITDHSDVQHQLRQVLNTYGAAVFGGITLFSLEAQTSIMGDAEALSCSRTLAELGITTRQLCWPADILREEYLDQAADETDPHQRMRIRRIRKAVAEYTKKEH